MATNVQRSKNPFGSNLTPTCHPQDPPKREQANINPCLNEKGTRHRADFYCWRLRVAPLGAERDAPASPSAIVSGALTTVALGGRSLPLPL